LKRVTQQGRQCDRVYGVGRKQKGSRARGPTEGKTDASIEPKPYLEWARTTGADSRKKGRDPDTQWAGNEG